jgi:radical SAM superfamily enzyme YgiQ (UPF0313 family)
MARVALIKLFTGLNLGVSQLSGDLQRAGHDTRIIYFKDFLVVPVGEAHRYQVTEYAGVNVSARAEEYVWNCYTPFSEREYELLLDELRAFKPDLIGFSLTALTLKPAAEVTERIRRALGVPIIWGGAGPTLEPEWCLDHADLVCHGEGEELLVELANRLDAGADYADIPGLWLRRNGTLIRNADAPLPELDTIAIPDFEPARTVHINDDRIRRDVYPHNLGKQYAIMTQRGCPFSCSFCIESVYQDMWGKKNSLRRRSVDVVIEELVQAKQRHDIRQVMFYDDVFTVNPRWLREFAPRYKAEVGLPFWCYTYPTTTNRDDILLLKDAGLRSITMGIQSGSEEILRNDFNRPVVQNKTYEAARIIAECGVAGFFDLITKVQFEKEKHLRETFDFLLDLPVEMKSVGFGAMTSFPNYGYTKKVEADRAAITISDDLYRYYHKLYLLTRTTLPRPVVKAIGGSRLFRRFPRLIDPLLPKHLPVFFMADDDDGLSSEVLNLPHATAVIPGGKLDRGLPSDAARA